MWERSGGSTSSQAAEKDRDVDDDERPITPIL